MVSFSTAGTPDTQTQYVAQPVLTAAAAPGSDAASSTATDGDVPAQGLLRWTDIPLPLLGGSVDFLPCTDVRSTLRVCKAFRGARTAVQTLNIVKREEMDVPFAKQFVNVREVNIWLWKYRVNPDGTGGWVRDYDILLVAPMFLASFPHLERAYVGDKHPHLGGREAGEWLKVQSSPCGNRCIVRSATQWPPVQATAAISRVSGWSQRNVAWFMSKRKQ